MSGWVVNYFVKLLSFFKFIVFGRVFLAGRSYRVSAFLLNRLVVQAAERGRYEPELISLYRRELKAGNGCFIDVGANYGQTLFSLLDVAPDVEYLGVEPQPACASSILHFLKANALDRHKLVCACLNSSNSLVGLGLSYEGDVRASIIEGFRPKGHFSSELLVPSITGDQLVLDAGVGRVQFIKVDVEGAELEVLMSLKSTIEKFKPTITFEVLPHKLVANNESLPVDVIQVRVRRENALADFLTSQGYYWKLLDDKYELDHDISADPCGLVRNYVARPLK